MAANRRISYVFGENERREFNTWGREGVLGGRWVLTRRNGDGVCVGMVGRGGVGWGLTRGNEGRGKRGGGGGRGACRGESRELRFWLISFIF